MIVYELTLFLKLIVAIYLILFIHNFSHFYFARKNHIKVLSCNIGRGPLLFHITILNCSWSFHALPINGSTHYEEKPFQQTSFNKKVGFLLAGPVGNLLTYSMCYGFFSYQQTGAFFSGVAQAIKGIYHLLLLLPSIQLTMIYSPERDLMGQLELYQSLTQPYE